MARPAPTEQGAPFLLFFAVGFRAAMACLERSHLVKGNSLGARRGSSEAPGGRSRARSGALDPAFPTGAGARRPPGGGAWHPVPCGTGREGRAPGSTTSVLTATTQQDAIGAGITAGAGTRLVLQLLLGGRFSDPPCQLPGFKGRALVCPVTSSGYPHWERCAPAAFLRSSSDLSGYLSRIEP